MGGEETEFGPWNPGIKSQIPREILPFSSMFRSANVRTTFEQAHEYADLTGLAPQECVEFSAERLAAHEVLVRVTADLCVPDGPEYADLGINMRGMVATIYDNHVAAHLPKLNEHHQTFRKTIIDLAVEELNAQIFQEAKLAQTDQSEPSGGLFGLFKKKPKKETRPQVSLEERALGALTEWKKRLAGETNELESSLLQALIKIVGGIAGHRGRLLGDAHSIAEIVAGQVCNTLGAIRMGEKIAPIFSEAAREEKYEFLPAQEEPLVMNIKGASASGKSTMRNAQRQLAERLGVPWNEFALISPDYWRKYLLDYDALGEHHKYAGALSGHELAIVDKKLDRYMAEKARAGLMSHLLIDRFRFDSFSPEQDRSADSTLLSRFGHTIYLFFMVTPPEATVERAWYRGIDTGRYKAVDDLLFHNIEAFTGMPQLFLSWALSKNKSVHYEFLDNSVAQGETPRTIAFGQNGDMTILDLASMLNIDRFKRINFNADRPEDVYDGATLSAADNTDFLMQCVEYIPRITLVDQITGKPYAQLEDGKCIWGARDKLPKHKSADVDAALVALSIEKCAWSEKPCPHPPDFEKEKTLTLGAWT